MKRMLHRAAAFAVVSPVHTDSKEGAMRRFKMAASAAVALAFVVVGFASAGSPVTKCPTGYDCVPANVQFVSSSKTSTFSSTTIVEMTALVPQAHQYMVTEHVAVTIDEVPGGIHPSHGCINPVAKGYIASGGKFSNTGGRLAWRFTDYWPNGTMLCDYHLVHKNGETYLEGTKSSCGNKHVRIYLSSHKFTKYVPVKRFHTVTDWVKTYHRWYSNTVLRKHTGGSATKHNCKGTDKAGRTLYGTLCIKKVLPNAPTPPPVQTTPSTPTPEITVTHNCNGVTAGANWSDSLQACVVVVCGNVVIVAANSPNATITQGGNCNNAPPPATCTDKAASNFGGALPCVYPPAKCTDTNASNYGGALPCVYPPAKCTDTKASNYGGPLPCTYPPPVVTHYTNLTCQGQEEITGGGSSKLVCSVSNDNGAPISLSVNVLSNPGAILVSGIQCSSQGGTPECKGNGTFEIRIGGVNEGSAPVYSDLRVVASSNGVPSSPFNQRYKIDPRCSNFC